MAKRIYPIYLISNEALRTKCEDVMELSDDIKKLSEDMIHTCIASGGAGLAAPQIGKLYSIIVIMDGRHINKYSVMYNPKIIESSEEEIDSVEGCLSIPGCLFSVKRKKWVKVLYKNELFEDSILDTKYDLNKLYNIVVQHEIDHLNGISLHNIGSASNPNMLNKILNKKQITTKYLSVV